MPSLSGLALHSGVLSTVTASLRPDDGLGLRFFFPGFGAPLDFAALAKLRRAAKRATVLGGGEGEGVIRTPEHLLAAAIFFAEIPLDVHCDAPEPPGLDGSAKPWHDLFATLAETNAELGCKLQPNSGAREQECGLEWAYEGDEGRMTAEAAPNFSVEYVLERGDFRSAFTLHALEDAPREVLPARTFIFHRDWKNLA